MLSRIGGSSEVLGDDSVVGSIGSESFDLFCMSSSWDRSLAGVGCDGEENTSLMSGAPVLRDLEEAGVVTSVMGDKLLD